MMTAFSVFTVSCPMVTHIVGIPHSLDVFNILAAQSGSF